MKCLVNKAMHKDNCIIASRKFVTSLKQGQASEKNKCKPAHVLCDEEMMIHTIGGTQFLLMLQ